MCTSTDKSLLSTMHINKERNILGVVGELIKFHMLCLITKRGLLGNMLKIIASTLKYHNFFDSLWWCPFGGAGTVWKCIFFLLLQVNSRSSKEEILHLLAKKGDQVSKLEAKIAGEQIFKNSFKWTHPVCRFIKYYTCSWSVWSG